MPTMRDNSAGVGREAPWEVCESWVVMGWKKFVLSLGCDHAQTFLFAKSILADPRPDPQKAIWTSVFLADAHCSRTSELTHAGPEGMNREAELRRPSGIVCSDFVRPRF